MKKILSVLLLISTLTKSQPELPVNIVNISPENACIGDTVNVCFTIDRPIKPDFHFKVTVHFFYFTVGLPVDTYLFDGSIGDLGNFDTISPNQVYCAKMNIPINFNTGQWCATANLSTPDLYCIWVNNCTVGVEEIAPNKNKSTYISVYGPVLMDTRTRRKVVLLPD